MTAHGVYFYSYVALSQHERISGLNMSHISRKLAAWFSFCFVLACALQRRVVRDLTCAVTPAEPHVFQLGKLHSVATLQCRNQRHNRHTGLSSRWRQILCSFLRNWTPLPKPSQPTPTPPRALSFHDTWTYDSSTLGLSFNVCQGQSSQRTHMEGWSSSQRVRHNKCKGRWGGDCCCTGRLDNTCAHRRQSHAVHVCFNEQQCGPGCQLCSATKRVIHALLCLFFFLTYRTVMVAWICIPTMENILNSYYMLLLQQTWWTECGPLTTSFRPSGHFVHRLISLFIHYFFKSLNQSCPSKRSNYFWY